MVGKEIDKVIQLLELKTGRLCAVLENETLDILSTQKFERYKSLFLNEYKTLKEESKNAKLIEILKKKKSKKIGLNSFLSKWQGKSSIKGKLAEKELQEKLNPTLQEKNKIKEIRYRISKVEFQDDYIIILVKNKKYKENLQGSKKRFNNLKNKELQKRFIKIKIIEGKLIINGEEKKELVKNLNSLYRNKPKRRKEPKVNKSKLRRRKVKISEEKREFRAEESKFIEEKNEVRDIGRVSKLIEEKKRELKKLQEKELLENSKKNEKRKKKNSNFEKELKQLIFNQILELEDNRMSYSDWDNIHFKINL